MISKNDIYRLRQGTTDEVLYSYLSQQDAGFKSAVERVQSANPSMGVLEQAKFPSAMIDLYYDTQPLNAPDPLTTQMATAAAESSRQDDMSIGGFAKNVVSSGANFVGGIANAVMHPIQTAQNVGKLALGAGINAVETITGDENTFDNPFGSEDVAKNVGDFYLQRYGGLDNLRKTMYEDPIGFLADVSTVLTAGGAAIQGVGKLGQLGTAAATAGKASVPLNSLAATAGKMSGAVTKAGKAVSAAAPGALLGKAVSPLQKGVETLPQRMINSLIKPAAKEFRFGKDPGRAIVREGIIATSLDDLLTKVSTKIDDVGGEIRKQILTRSASAPPQTNISAIIESAFAEPLKQAKKLEMSEPGRLAYLQNLRSDLMREYGGVHVPLGVFDAKQGVQSLIKFDAADPFSGTRNEALWRLFGALKKENNQNVPGLKSLNERYSELSAAKVSIERRAATVQRQSVMGTLPYAGGLGAAFATGDPLTGIGVGLATKAAGTTAGKTIAAQALRPISQVTAPIGKVLPTASKASRLQPEEE